jgi:hypothetical protein
MRLKNSFYSRGGALKKRLWLMMAIGMGWANTSGAQVLPSLTVPVKASASVPKPLALILKDKTPDSARFKLPPPPSKYIDDTDLVLTNEVDNAPHLNNAALRTLTGPEVLVQIPVVNKADKKSNHYYWHPFKDWNYAHYRDGDRQWYGWRTGPSFHWVLWSAGHFWWYNPYAERWLYFDRGYWWWQSLTKDNQIQVFLDDGHFHACDLNGVLGDDLMQTGKEDIVPDITPQPTRKPKGHQPLD